MIAIKRNKEKKKEKNSIVRMVVLQTTKYIHATIQEGELTIVMARQNIDTLAALGKPTSWPWTSRRRGDERRAVKRREERRREEKRRAGIVKQTVSTSEVEILMRM